MTKPVLLHIFHNFDTGGVQMRTVALINALGGDYHHKIIACGGSFKAAEALNSLENISLFKDFRLKGGLWTRLRTMAAAARESGADLLLSYNWATAELGLANQLLTRLPHIHHECGFGVEEADRQLPRRVWFRRLALRRTHKIIVPSRTLMRLAKDVWHMPDSRMKLIFDGIDIDRFDRPGDPAALPGFHRQDADIVLGTVAPLRPEKNLGRFLRLLARLRREGRLVKGVIVGDGGERPALEAQAKALGVAAHVHFAGFRADVERLYGLFDIFAMTSETEQLPNGLLQAMAARRPALATRVGDIAEMVAPENRRFIVERQDENALFDAACALIADAGLRQALGEANSRTARETYNLPDMASAYNNCFREALG